MAIVTPGSSTSTAATAPDSSSSYGAPLAVVTTLFFMWGFLTCLNDILVPHLKPIFDLNYTQIMLIQFAFFGAYFVFSIPSAKIIDWIGYQRSMVVGLLTMGHRSISFCAGGQRSIVPAVSDRAHRACGWNYVFAGRGESLRDGSGQTPDGIESPESYPGVQLAGNFSGTFLRRPSDSECGAKDDGRDTGAGARRAAGLSLARGSHRQGALRGTWASR